ncbi:RagB/SusD family nutrient uptake outer membrane protein [Puteibacter caeruleilacunae]|nr:RagB/SusD family nutrient uptake outer membrane protein [Puteibacter caeruleilacunae]
MKTLRYTMCMGLLLSLMLFSGCEDELNVINENQPDTERVLKTAEDAKSVVDGSMAAWFEGTNGYNVLIFNLAADQITTTNAWRSFWNFAKEPRVAFDNTTISREKIHLEDIWEDMYGAITSANDVLKVISSGKTDMGDDQAAYEAAAYFVKGLGHAILATCIDQAFIIEIDSEVEDLELKPYAEVIEAAMTNFDKAIQLCGSNTFTLNAAFINGITVDNVLLGQLANSMAARYSVAVARTASENNAVNWSKVLSYAQNGIEADIMPVNGGENSLWFAAGTGFAWFGPDMRVDQRILNMLDPNQPLMHPLEGAAPLVESDDSRAETYLQWQDNFGWLKPERGRELFSSYTYVKYGNTDEGDGVIPLFEHYENDLLKAEAMIRTSGPDADAAALINKSRVANGNLAALTGDESQEDMLEALFYERELELMLTTLGLGWSDMRRRDMLQAGTMLHLPIPAKELGVLQMPLYTFTPGQEGTASGANAWK